MWTMVSLVVWDCCHLVELYIVGVHFVKLLFTYVIGLVSGYVLLSNLWFQDGLCE